MAQCPYCFKPLPKNGICSCNYDQSEFYTDQNVLRPGTVVGRDDQSAGYLIGAVLGQGGFGITYHGYDPDENREVAIKEFFPRNMVYREKIPGNTGQNANSTRVISIDPNDKSYKRSLKMFYREARILAEMRYIPHIPRIYDRFEENGTAYIVMEYVEGKSLKQLLRENGPYPEEKLVRLLDPVLESLQDIHELGIIHLDIAPDNIAVDGKGNPVLLDFGASRIEVVQTDGNGQVVSSSVLNVQKKGFTPLEQLIGESEPRSDIYAMGATYYTMLTGKVPQESAGRGNRDLVKPLTDFGITAGISDAVMKAMAIRSDDRWNSVEEFRRALDAVYPDQRKKTYEKAKVLMNAGRYEEAQELFLEIAGYRDADDLAQVCESNKTARCPYCFRLLPENGICDCDYDQSRFYGDRSVLRPGTVVGARYQIGGVLGRGGFGITYHALDLETKREAAIKEFFPKDMVARGNTGGRYYSKQVIPTDPENDSYRRSLKMFRREARALQKMSGIPNIPGIYGRFDENGTAYIVMEYVEGKSLMQLLREKGSWKEEELIRLLDPMLVSLQKVHELGIVHRDIAPDNIAVDGEGNPVLLDFGASRIESLQTDETGQVVGSSTLTVQKTGFTPLEQLNGESEPRSDIYALGATYYMLLTGQRPQESLARVYRDDLKPLTDFGIIPGVSDVVMKAMAMRVDDRWNSVEAFRRALNDACHDPRKEKYNEAKKLMDAGSCEDALELFRQAAGYKDADDLSEICRQKLEERERKYKEACLLYEQGTLESLKAAIKLFSEIMGWKDVDQLLVSSSKKILELREAEETYQQAVKLMAAGDWSEAKRLFETIPDHKDTKTRISECNKKISETIGETIDVRKKIDELMSLGTAEGYWAALDLLEKNTYVKDAEILKQICEKKIGTEQKSAVPILF
ncbi:MAG: serine/threonine protein kinase [Anaerolineaceae bacterium]|nr:serine/threonine protein kinase [Anaerolineaceae bacterium]